jgi:hypothetical protein
MITDANIREYLLGRLNSDAKLVESIDEQILTDPELSISADVIEDEIIEEYLEGSLSPEDTRAVETYFLRPPERQRKLKTARLFNRYLEAESRNVKATQPTRTLGLFKAFRVGGVLLSFRTCAELAAAAVFVASILILSNQRRELESATKQMGQQLSQERQHSAALDRQLGYALQSLQPAIAVLNLVRPGLERGAPELPQVKVNSGTKSLHVEVALSSKAPGKYNVQLLHNKKMVWSQNEIAAIAVPGGAILRLDIPADVLPQGTNELAVKPSGDVAISYWFSVSKLQ